jgi:hypothetical protein
MKLALRIFTISLKTGLPLVSGQFLGRQKPPHFALGHAQVRPLNAVEMDLPIVEDTSFVGRFQSNALKWFYRKRTSSTFLWFVE